MELPDGRVRKHRRVYNTPGDAHELTFSCLGRSPFLRSPRASAWVIAAIEQARRTHHFDVWAYVIMPEHVHLLLRPREPSYDIAAITKSFKQSSSRRAIAWLRAHAPAFLSRLRVEAAGRVEHHFWQPGGGYDRNIVTHRAAVNSIRYIHRNPVERGLCEKPDDWPYSSAGWWSGRCQTTAITLTRPGYVASGWRGW